MHVEVVYVGTLFFSLGGGGLKLKDEESFVGSWETIMLIRY